jgi:thymidylate synthase
LLWFLRGDTNIKFLVDNNCHIWDGDAFKNFMENSEGDPDLIWNQKQFIEMIKTDDEFAKQWGELGPIYGRQWRNWNAIFDGGVDQIANLINDIKTNPDSRRLMVNAWNVGELNQMVLPPCHYGFQVYTRELSLEERYKIAFPIWKEKYGPLADMMVPTNVDNTPYKIPTRAISLMWNQRSVDTPLGLPFNIASYALLLEMLARETNMIADELVGNLGDCHIYLDQQDGVREQLTRSPMAVGQLVMNDEFWNPDVNLFDQIEHIQPTDFYINDYHSHPTIKFPLSN